MSLLPVLIIGAGPTGLALACELARFGVKIRIVDKATSRSDKSKALGVQARTLEALEIMGGEKLVEQALSVGVQCSRANIYFEGKQTSIDLRPTKSRFGFILMLEQSETERILEEKLKSYGVLVERAVELVKLTQYGDRAVMTLQSPDRPEEIVESQYAVGCDGAHSSVRHILDLPFEGGAYDSDFLLGDVRVEWNLKGDESHLFSTKHGVMACFPIKGSGDRFRLISGLREKLTSKRTDLELSELQDLASKIVSVPIKIHDPKWLTRFRVHHRIVSRFRKGRVFIAGDAAHIHSPAGGQGMNTGIQDAQNLGWKLAFVLSRAKKSSILDTYEQERIPVAQEVIKGTDRVTRMGLKPDTLITRLVRSQIAPRIVRSSWVQKRIPSVLAQTQIGYVKTPALKVIGTAGKYKAGMRVPDFMLESLPKGTQRLYPLLHACRKHVLLVFSQGIDFPPGPYELAHAKSEFAGYWLLVRPDGYIGTCGDLKQTDKIVQYFDLF